MDSTKVNQKLDEDKELKKSSLEKQLNQWTKRRDEMRKVALTALDPAFVRRHIDRCSAEIERLTRMIANL